MVCCFHCVDEELLYLLGIIERQHHLERAILEDVSLKRRQPASFRVVMARDTVSSVVVDNRYGRSCYDRGMNEAAPTLDKRSAEVSQKRLGKKRYARRDARARFQEARQASRLDKVAVHRV